MIKAVVEAMTLGADMKSCELSVVKRVMPFQVGLTVLVLAVVADAGHDQAMGVGAMALLIVLSAVLITLSATVSMSLIRLGRSSDEQKAAASELSSELAAIVARTVR